MEYKVYQMEESQCGLIFLTGLQPSDLGVYTKGVRFH
jgi:hypothetical protein